MHFSNTRMSYSFGRIFLSLTSAYVITINVRTHYARSYILENANLSILASLNATSPIPSDEAQKWHNVTSFLARCWQAGFFNASLQALHLFRAILEQPVTDISALQQALPIVLEWIMHSGIALYQSIESSESQEGSREQSAGSLYTGPNQLCVERWQFWKNRLEELAGQLQGHSKEMALDCASKMESISS